ncbi:MAG: Asp-tRNA(Asn)/Glu-tRNA(Gln) amidotransferase subunit GatA [Alphaproteobacteria bacterium]|nr:Asp-tRNA(Asn)/Glu-tRNA(Gln) amidotransferase subunit GatA [Alphaproteobacteria bacterium]
MNELLKLSITELAAKLKSREVKSVDVTKAALERIKERNEKINAYITISEESALTQAAESDKKLDTGIGGMLEGVPLGIKDLFCTKDIRTTAGSKMFNDFIPPYESTVTQKLLNEGAVFLGKLNLDQFGMGGSNENSAFGSVINPIHEEQNLTPGGSSGGSSAALSDYQCFGAMGTDTGGSVRQPAAFTNTVGFRPTYGRCSRFGVVAFASSLDQPGFMARTVEDVALMFRAGSGHDENDSTSANIPVEAYNEILNDTDVKGLKIGLPKEYFVDELDVEIKTLINTQVEKFKAAGAEIIDISLPHTKYAVPAYYIIAPAEAAANLSRYDGMRYGLRVEGDNLAETYAKSRSAGFGWEAKRRIMMGNYVLSSGYYDAYYTKAQKVRTLIAQDFEKAFEQVDVIFAPTAPELPYALGSNIQDPITMYLGDIFTVPASLAGIPAITVPAGFSKKGLPTGLQILGKAFNDAKVLQVAKIAETLNK